MLTLVAALFLGFDGAVLVALGAWARQPPLAIVGLTCCVAAAGVLWSWRWHRRRLDEIDAERHAVREEARALRDLLREP